MKNKFSIICLFISICVFAAVPVFAENKDIDEVIDGIISFKKNEAGVLSIQDWIDKSLAPNAGITSEWYIMALRQSGIKCDFSLYRENLIAFLNENKVDSATTRQKYALALIAAGQEEDENIKDIIENSIGEQGIISYIFGLHLLNNGYESAKYKITDLIETLLSFRLEDGGWALGGTKSDVDVTSMAIQALAPYYASDINVKTAVDKSILFLSEKQLEDGDYSSYGVKNAESVAQVIVALCSLGIDCLKDERFIKNGNTLLDGLKLYKLKDGSFSHTAGDEYNHTATVQAFLSVIAFKRSEKGACPMYVFDTEEPIISETSPILTEETETNKANDYKYLLLIFGGIIAVILIFIIFLSFKNNIKSK